MSTKALLVFTVSALLFIPLRSTLANNPSIVINEVAWMGTKESYNNEWIELYNVSSVVLDLDGWELTTEDRSVEIKLTGKIDPKGFFLLERTDDETLPSIRADLIYKGGLNNKGEELKLINPEKEVIDEINCSSGWFAGDNKEKMTMERKNALATGSNSQDWQTSKVKGGTPRKENSSEGSPLKENEQRKEYDTYPKNIFINELLPSPEGSDNENEWIEIFNQNSFKVDLSNWQLADTIGKLTTFTFPEESSIKGKGFLIFSRPVTKITLNNGGDELKIINPKGEIVDMIAYDKAPRNKSFNRTSSGWEWSCALTPGNINNIQNISSSPQKENNEKEEPLKKPLSGKADYPIEEELATINKQFTPQQFPYVLLAGLVTAFSSGIITIFLKKKLDQKP